MTRPRWYRTRVRPAAHGPLHALVAAIAHLHEQGRRTPCEGDDRFTSDDREQRTAAATECVFCPIRRQCSAYAREQREPWGTWAGVDRSPRPRATREPAADR